MIVKKFLATVVALLCMVSLFAGCQQNVEDPTSSDTVTSSTQNSSDTETETTESDTETSTGNDTQEPGTEEIYTLYFTNGAYGRVYTVSVAQDSGEIKSHPADYGTQEFDGSFSHFDVGEGSNVDIAYASVNGGVEFRISRFGGEDCSNLETSGGRYFSAISQAKVNDEVVDFEFEDGVLILKYHTADDGPSEEDPNMYTVYFTNGAYGRVYQIPVESQSGSIKSHKAEYGTQEFDGSFKHFSVGNDSNIDVDYVVKNGSIEFRLSRYDGEDCSDMETSGGRYFSAVNAMKVNDEAVDFEFEDGALIFSFKLSEEDTPPAGDTLGALKLYLTNGAYGRVYTLNITGTSGKFTQLLVDYNIDEYNGSFKQNVDTAGENTADISYTVNGNTIDFVFTNFRGNANCSEIYWFSGVNKVTINDKEVEYDLDGNEIRFSYAFEGQLPPVDDPGNNDPSVSDPNKDPVTYGDTIERVVIVGVDGAGAFFKDAKTPNFDSIFANGAVTYSALTMYPSLSAECWASCLHGVEPSKHGITNDNSGSPDSLNPAYPSIFKVIRDHSPNARLASFCSWVNVNFSIVENGIDVYKYNANGNDEKVTNKVCEYIAENDAELIFVHLNDPDRGHDVGFGSQAHLNEIADVDNQIGLIYDALADAGLLETTLFIVTTDHGGNGNSHGGWTDAEKYITFAAVGPKVLAGSIGDMNISDTAAIVLYALGYEQPDNWTCRVPSGIFAGITAEARPEEKH